MTTLTTGPTAAGGGELIPARPLAAQAHALRAAAALIEQAGITGLYLVISGNTITIQVPEPLGGPAARAAAVARLAAATGGRPARDTTPGTTQGWIFADGQAAGHAVRIFTPIQDAP